MGDLSSVRVGDEVYVHHLNQPARCMTVVRTSPVWVYVSETRRFARKDGNSPGGVSSACTAEQHEAHELRAQVWKRLMHYGLSIPIGWSAAELVALADAVEKIKGGTTGV